jgi:hypothetical protein
MFLTVRTEVNGLMPCAGLVTFYGDKHDVKVYDLCPEIFRLGHNLPFVISQRPDNWIPYSGTR